MLFLYNFYNLSMSKLLLSILFLFVCVSCFAQTLSPDEIIGEWLNEEKDGKIEIYKTGNLYYGKITWGSNIYEEDGKTSKKDVNNPDEKLKARNLLNLVILHHFEYTDGIWDNGKIYDPKSGKTYHCTMKIKDKILEIRGYVGISLLGRTTYWEKLE